MAQLFSQREFSAQKQPELPGRALQSWGNRSSLAQKTQPQSATAKQQSALSPQSSNALPQKATPQPAQASIAAAAVPQPAHHLPPIPLRVAIAIDTSALSIATSESGAVVDASGRVIGELSAQNGVGVAPVSTGLQVGEWQGPSVVWIKTRTPDGLIFVNDRWYRGAVQLIAQPKGLLAVNHVDLESYLYSVVGAEMPASWSPEALKAQAIAARSYALVHISRPASDYFDLGSTTRWQAYNGVETEMDTTHYAVNETRGILLSYQGGVVESLYASSSQLVQEAHGGFGMSQEGAQQLAQQNFNFQQILGRFYPGTSLAVLNIQ